jgi:hypothetical protein
MPDDTWSNVATYTDRISAEAVLALLVAERISGQIVSNEHIPGLGSEFAVLVPSEWRSRAIKVLEQSQVPETELTLLATGELPGAGKEK